MPENPVQNVLASLKARFDFPERLGNLVNGGWAAPVNGTYFTDTSPITGDPVGEFARSGAADVERALDAAHAAKAGWAKNSPAARAAVLNRIADRLESRLDDLALAETLDNGKPIRESVGADLPLAIDQFRYFAAAIRAQEGTLSEIDADTVAYHFYEPLGVVGQIIPWNFPLLMAAWKIAPALAAGNAVVLKPAEQTPLSILLAGSLVRDLLPPGVLNIVTGFGEEAGAPLAKSPRIQKLAFTGETATGRLIQQYAGPNLIPVTLELGGKNPNLFFADLFDEDDDLLDKAIEGFVGFALNQGEVCTAPSRAIVHESIVERFLERAVARTKAIRQGNPFDFQTQIGAQTSEEQFKRILGHIDAGKKESKLLLGGGRASVDGFEGGYFIQPTIFAGKNSQHVFREEIFGPVVGVTTFKTLDEAVAIANDTPYGLAAGVWTRDQNTAYRAARGIQAGRVWINAYHLYPAHSSFGGYKDSGLGRENHRLALSHYQQVKAVVTSYSPKRLGLF